MTVRMSAGTVYLPPPTWLCGGGTWKDHRVPAWAPARIGWYRPTCSALTYGRQSLRAPCRSLLLASMAAAKYGTAVRGQELP